MSTRQKVESLEEKQRNKPKVGDLISVPFQGKYIKGIVEKENEKSIQIKNHENGLVNLPNNEQIVKMFPGQKYDFRELLVKNKNGKTPLDKLNAILSKTPVGNYKNLQKGDRVQLLTGGMTRNPIKVNALIKDENNPEQQNLISFNIKLQLTRNASKGLDVVSHKELKKPNIKVYGVDLTADEQLRAKDKGQTITIERTTKPKDGLEPRPYKSFVMFDKDLNNYVTKPHSEIIETRIKKALAKKEQKKETPKKTTTSTTKTISNAKGITSKTTVKEEKHKKNKSRKI